jgi:predicted anti-sigma-YlaC factor YlaD
MELNAMMTCKDVSMLVSTGQLATAPLARRLGIRLHLAMCRHCRAFKQQIEVIARMARGAGLTFEAEPSADFEAGIVSRLES